jgi:hypothetical protein
MGYQSFMNFCNALLIIMATISTISSVMTLVILWQMRSLMRNNSYLRIVLHICLCQMMYDLAFYLQVTDMLLLETIHTFLYSWFGTATAFWTLLLSCTLLYMVVTLQSCAMVSVNLTEITTTITVICAGVGFWGVFASKSQFPIYYWFRNAVIFFSLVVQCVIIARLRQLRSQQTAADQRVYEVLSALVDKMQYYPWVQLVTRAGADWLQIS